MRDKTVKDLTEADNQVLEHYRSYERRSPTPHIGINFENFEIINYDNAALSLEKPLGYFLPSSVILFITMHGRTKEPFITPVNVERHIATDFGTVNCIGYHTLGDPIELIRVGFKKKEKKTGEFIKNGLVRSAAKIRASAEKGRKDDSDPEVVAYRESRHHEKVKTFKKNMPMFNKEYVTYDPDDPDGIFHFSLRIFVRADLPLDSKVKDVLFEIKIKEEFSEEQKQHFSSDDIPEQSITLENILYFLQNHGVQDVALFDWSCQGDRRSPIHRTRYG